MLKTLLPLYPRWSGPTVREGVGVSYLKHELSNSNPGAGFSHSQAWLSWKSLAWTRSLLWLRIYIGWGHAWEPPYQHWKQDILQGQEHGSQMPGSKVRSGIPRRKYVSLLGSRLIHHSINLYWVPSRYQEYPHWGYIGEERYALHQWKANIHTSETSEYLMM